MRIGDTQSGKEPEQELPLEVQLWIKRGWSVLPTERTGIVLSGPKEMLGRTKLLIAFGILLLAGCYFLPKLAWIGVAFLVVAVIDYKFATKPPTKFFPADGEKKRTLER